MVKQFMARDWVTLAHFKLEFIATPHLIKPVISNVNFIDLLSGKIVNL